MSEDSFILMNLKDSKEIAAAMQNETAQKILDYLTKGSATESQIAKELQIALSTVHYNLQQLKKAKLVKTEEYTYSKRGKEILHYSLAKKLIIIAPSGEENNWRELIKKVIPALGITVLAGYLVKSLQNTPEQVMPFAARMTETGVEDTQLLMAETPKLVQESTIGTLSSFEWFIMGAITVIVTLLIVELFASKKWFKLKRH